MISHQNPIHIPRSLVLMEIKTNFPFHGFCHPGIPSAHHSGAAERRANPCALRPCGWGGDE